MPDFVYLASASPRRRELLERLGVASRPLVAAADEDAEALEVVRPGESPRAYVRRVVALKADAARRRLATRGLAPAPILVGDTTVALGRTILGKPDDADDTAIAVLDDARIDTALSESRVRMRSIDDAEIDAYVDAGEPFGKAGAYAIQGRAAAFVAHIAGSHSGIVGLPLFETAALLQRFGVALLQSSRHE